ncbi:MAG: TetR family transcriptional regulator [Alphaproteobacteria bacterium]|nr:TetR family transcriptional regulator [Alphaproteobacteria bacterium]
MARPKNTEQRRAQIVDGLLEEMARQGYDAASTKDIAKAAGLSSGLLHYHFGSKQEVLLALIESLGQRLEGRLSDAIEAAEGGARARLDAALDAMLSLDPAHAPEPKVVACWIAVSAEATRKPEVGEAFGAQMQALRRALSALVVEALDEEGRDASAADELALALLAAIQGCFTLSASVKVPAGFAALRVRQMAAGLIAAQPLTGSAQQPG